jgi:DNA-binding protein H-NS
MSIDQLIAERDRIDQLIGERIGAEKKVLAAKLELIERFEARRTRNSTAYKSPRPDHRTKAAPKYRNPATGETWAGRGKQPRWLRKAINAGQSQEDFRISGPGGQGTIG